MVKRRKRDLYGNWVWEDDDEIGTPSENKSSNDSAKENSASPYLDSREGEEINLDWKDYIALSIASMETFLLPIVVFILVLLGIVVGLSIFH